MGPLTVRLPDASQTATGRREPVVPFFQTREDSFQYAGKQNLPEKDIAGFAMFVTTSKAVTHAHHLTESEISFPYFKDKLEAP